MSRSPADDETTAALSVVKGHPTDEELAALLVVLAGRTPQPGPSPSAPTSGWSAYARSVRSPLHPGPGVWRRSGRA